MSALRGAAERIAGMNRFPTRPPDRKLAIERAADRLADNPVGGPREPEPWDDFLKRIGVI